MTFNLHFLEGRKVEVRKKKLVVFRVIVSAENGIRTHADREVHGLSRPAR
jgi:hypothetical protein